VQQLNNSPVAPGQRHPFDLLLNRVYRARERLLRIQLRQRQLPGQGAHSLRLPQPAAVKPPVVS
jgi:hypothetical protein